MLARVLYGGGLAMVAVQLLSPGEWVKPDRLASNKQPVYAQSYEQSVRIPQPLLVHAPRYQSQPYQSQQQRPQPFATQSFRSQQFQPQPLRSQDYPTTRYPVNPFPTTGQRLTSNLPPESLENNRVAEGQFPSGQDPSVIPGWSQGGDGTQGTDGRHCDRNSRCQHGRHHGNSQDPSAHSRGYDGYQRQQEFSQRDFTAPGRAPTNNEIPGVNEDYRPIPQPTLPPQSSGYGGVDPRFAPRQQPWPTQSPHTESRRSNQRPSVFNDPPVKAWGI